MQGPAPSRNPALDNLRVTAMLLGLVVHGVLPFKATSIGRYPIHDRHAHVAADACYFALHDFRMQLFFLTAGFAAAALAARRGPGGFARDRARRIVAPLLLAIAAVAPVMYLLLAGHEAARGAGTGPDALDLALWLGPNFHLWFLYYLALCYLPLVVWLTAGRHVAPGGLVRAADAAFRWLLGRRWRALALAAAAVPVLWDMPDWWVETPQGWVPDGTIYAYYLGFFLFGVMLYRHRDLLAGFGRHWAILLTVANVAVLPVMLRLTVSGNWIEDEAGAAPPAWLVGWKAVAIFAGGLYTWLMVEGLVGLFQRYFAGTGAGWRYLAGASYWCYLAGFPVQVGLQVCLADHPMPGPVKFLLLTALTLSVLLVSYELVVRRSWLGRLLGAPRPAAPPGHPVPATPQAARPLAALHPAVTA